MPISPVASRFIAALAWLAVACTVAPRAAAQWWQAAPAPPSQTLAESLAGWTYTRTNLQALEPELQTEGAVSYLLIPAPGSMLSRQIEATTGYELRARVRLGFGDRATGSLRIDAAAKDLANRDEERIWVALSYQKSREIVAVSSYNAVPDHIGRKLNYANYRPDGNGPRSLAWEGDFRRLIEAEASAVQYPDTTWYTLRLLVYPDRFEVWLNHMKMNESTYAHGPAGTLRLDMRNEVQITDLELLPLPAASVYEPARLDYLVNSATLNGQALDPASLPPAGRAVTVDGVPFVRPLPDTQGRDHVDVGASWFQEANLTGNLQGRGNGVGARWRGALFHTPSRLQVRVPNRRYRAIHLIAAADDEADAVPVITAQFYRPQAGFPADFSGTVPSFSAAASEVRALPVTRADGSTGRLYLVTIPINPGDLIGFDDLDAMEIELTKQTRLFRAYPDPMYYSSHAYGRPSSVHVYAMTLEAPTLDIAVTPAQYGHIWTAPQTPSYTIRARNRTDQARSLSAVVTRTSWDGQETAQATPTLSIGPGQTAELTLELPVQRFGLHAVDFAFTDGEQTWTEQVQLAFLRPDDRERGGWEPGKGPFFGYWAWNGGHDTPGAAKEALVMALAGADGRAGTYEGAPEAEQAIARQYRMASLKHFSGADHYVTAELAANLDKMTEEEALAQMFKRLEEIETKPSDITQTRYLSFYPEPHLGMVTTGHLSDYLKRPAPVLDEASIARAERYARGLHVGVPAVRKRWPAAQIMMPHGDPTFFAMMLRHDPTLVDLVDGIAVDIPCFERPPEAQLHQVVVHRTWAVKEDMKKLGIADRMLLPMYEGPCIPDVPGSVEPDLAAGLVIRNSLILMAYGVDQFTGSFGAFNAGGYWGEQHYGGGLMHRKPLEYPKSMYLAYATMTRHLNRRAFRRWIPTGSTSVYLTEHQHYASGDRVQAAWTIHGTRPITATVPAGATVEVYDIMDNVTTLREANGSVTFSVDRLPRFIRGLPEDTRITLGEPDHSDVAPGPNAQRLTNLADGSWRISGETNAAYATNHAYHVYRELGAMTATPVDAPAAAGSRALAVHLQAEQAVEQYLMPYYTVITPAAPVAIPGKGSHLGLWVRASSDWGRVVYELHDAKGERWISVGTKDQWNCDDVHSQSYFAFDGWRYVSFEMPAHEGYDSFRDAGTTWWGSHDGDGIVDLPLQLAQVIIERRTETLYVNGPQPTSRDDVLLGDLYVEYETPTDATPEAVRISRLRMPVPAGDPSIANPIADMAAANTLPAITITAITVPPQQADGTRCFVQFDAVEGAETYSVWGAPYPDGRGAVQLGKDWKEPGGLVRGLRPEMDLWLFVTYARKDGRATVESKPSPGYAIRLQDMFSNK